MIFTEDIEKIVMGGAYCGRRFLRVVPTPIVCPIIHLLTLMLCLVLNSGMRSTPVVPDIFNIGR